MGCGTIPRGHAQEREKEGRKERGREREKGGRKGGKKEEREGPRRTSSRAVELSCVSCVSHS